MASANFSGRSKVYEYLLQTVLTDTRYAGTCISEQDLADEIGVSRTPVREALLLLSAQGLIELIPNRGAQVPALSREQVRHLFVFREMIEVSAARTVIDSGLVPVAAMRGLLQGQRDLAAASDLASSKSFIASDGDFHLKMIQATENEYMAQAYSSLRTRQLMVGTEAIFRAPNRKEQVCVEHAAIVDALAAKDQAKTKSAIEAHLRTTRDILLST